MVYNYLCKVNGAFIINIEHYWLIYIELRPANFNK